MINLIKENYKVLNIVNATQWHNAGYTGKNITVVIIDSNGKPRNHMKEYYIDHFNDQNETGHGSNVGYVIHLLAPDAKIIFLDKRYRERNYEWIKQNKHNIDLINISQAGLAGIQTPQYEKYKDLGIPIICASGNDGFENHISYPANYDWTIAIGAYHWRPEGAYGNHVPAYSNKGEKLDAVAPAEYYMMDDNGRTWLVDGTSYASPTVTGMLACYLQLIKEMGLPNPSTEELRHFIHNNCKDMYTEGHDYKSGHGLFILPDIHELKEQLSKRIKPTTPDSSPQPNKLPIQFKDVEAHWARTAIAWVSSQSLVSGYADGTFRPNNPITRLEFALILFRLSSVKNMPIKNKNIKFSDFNDSHKYYNIVRDVCSKGLLSGYSDGTFKPNEQLSREELAVILSRLEEVKNKKIIHNNSIIYKDVPINHWANSAIQQMYKKGIMSGVNQNEFGIGRSVTRAEIATVLYRILAN